MKEHIVSYTMDFVVIGGGLTGICAALAAARKGLRVALCHDRSVLGGNSSSECRVWICGATGMGFNRYADETGIVSELTQENLYRNPEGNPHLWDALLLDKVWAEKNITLLLECRMTRAYAENGRIYRVECEQFCSGNALYPIRVPVCRLHGRRGSHAHCRRRNGMRQSRRVSRRPCAL